MRVARITVKQGEKAAMAEGLTAFREIPFLDISAIPSGEEARNTLAADLDRMLREVGFLYIRGHSVPEASIAALRRQSQAFHALPLDEKLKLKLDRNFRGYIPINTSTVKTSSVATVTKPNQSESLMLMHEVAATDARALAGEPLQGPNQWPDPALLPDFRRVAEAYVGQMTALGRVMLDLIARALGVDHAVLARHFVRPTTFLRLLHYPPQPAEEGLFGSAPHTDYGFITLLAQDDVGGLEVRNMAGDWIAAPPIPNTFVMNVGDILSRWSNGRFASTPHRVINRSGRERYSQPFFFDPDMASEITPFAACVPPGEAPRFEPVLWRDYLMERIDKNYQSRKGGAQA